MRFIATYCLLFTGLCIFGQVRFGGGKMAVYLKDSSLTEYVYTEVGPWKEKRVWVNKGEWYAFMDENGDSITPFQYAIVRSFNNGFALAGWDDSIFYINRNGQQINTTAFLDGRDFESGYANVLTDSGWALIDTAGRLITDYRFDEPAVVQYNFPKIRCRKNGLWGILGVDGQWEYLPDYTYIGPDALAYRFGYKVRLYEKKNR